MTAFPSTPEQQEALRHLTAATAFSALTSGEMELDIPRQAAAMRAAFTCRFFAALGAALHDAAEELVAPPVPAGSSR
ncbi:MAG: hypothetical protein WD767_15110 [Alphaproteobacteria bacterium]